ncbi:two-component response regulator ORR2-like [Musa acuminata AAA Group]|uniref:two-component response regulator ORR2-like n=1 Tax=Musa acuminata AAA Group TaxID=214697 RepID=UPI0031DF323B
MTGYDLLKAVMEQSCQKPLPVIVMSSENEPQRINRCRAIGAEDFIIKPLQANDVLRLRSYARTGPPPPPSSSAKAGTKRKMTSELMAESGRGGSERRRPRLTGPAMA